MPSARNIGTRATPTQWLVVLAILAALGLGSAVAASSNSSDDEAVPCLARKLKYDSFVCVCNSTYCDTLPRFKKAENGTALVYKSTRSGLRFHKGTEKFKSGSAPSASGVLAYQRIKINRTVTYQKIQGFGGAFTDAAGLNMNLLSNATRTNIMRSYFSQDGLEYNLGRLPIGGTDFSTRPYTYQDDSDDITLKEFKLQMEDYTYKIPFIKWAQKLMPDDIGDLRLYAATWSPPAWMKTNDKLTGVGFLKKKYYQCYANYHIKFLEAYEKENVSVYSVSTGNEPLNGLLPVYGLNALGWFPWTVRSWIAENFGPTLRSSNYSSIKIVAIDDQRYLLPWWLELVMADKEAAKYIDGVAVHWYGDFITPASILSGIHDQYPDKFIISTEASNGDKPWQFVKVELGDWARARYYVGDIIEDLNNWATGWIDWNLALNMTGGPNWKKNYVDSPVIVNPERDEFYKQPMFYAMGHFSKFIPRDSVRVKVTSESGFLISLFGSVQHTAFLRPDGGMTVVLLNKHGFKHKIAIEEDGYGYMELEIQPYSFTTLVYW